MKKKRKKVLLIILAVFAILVAAVFYFLPVRLLVHTMFLGPEHFTEVRLDDTIHFDFKDWHMLFEAEVNGEPDTLMYDSGVNSMMILMYTPSTQPEGMKFYRNRVTGADKKSSIKTTTLPVKIGTDRVDNTGIGLAVLNSEPPLCEKLTISDHHLLGFESLDIGHCILDFTHREIRFLSYSEPIDTIGYVPIKCAVKRNVLWVYPQIEGVEYECIFDTGNGNAGFLLKDEERVKNPKLNDCVYEGSYGTSIGGRTSNRRFVRVPQGSFSLAGIDKEVDLTYVKDLPHDNMGLKAISQFDWIISMSGTPKVYVKPRVTDENKYFEYKRYRLVASEGYLKIVSRHIDGKEAFKVGDRIVSINGEPITGENICYYYNLLSESNDWSGFDVVVK